MDSLPSSSLVAVLSISSYVAPKSLIVQSVLFPVGAGFRMSRPWSTIECPRPRHLNIRDRNMHDVRPTRLDEDAPAVREVGALDATEGHLEQRVAVVRVRLQGDPLPVGLPRTQHPGAAPGAGDVRIADEQVLAVGDGLHEGP